MNVPDERQAETLLSEAAQLNPGFWIGHSRVAGRCARAIAEKCEGMDAGAAYALGLLHDIGRRFGVSDLRHVVDGYRFMNGLGFGECARVCLTHSFPCKHIAAYSGKNDCTDEETAEVAGSLDAIEYTRYDRLIQLCDVLAYPDRAVIIEKRLVDVSLRHGFNEFTLVKWKSFFELKEYFDAEIHGDIYRLLGVSLF